MAGKGKRGSLPLHIGPAGALLHNLIALIVQLGRESFLERKGNPQVCDNHQGISLLSIAGKILARVPLTEEQ